MPIDEDLEIAVKDAAARAARHGGSLVSHLPAALRDRGLEVVRIAGVPAAELPADDNPDEWI